MEYNNQTFGNIVDAVYQLSLAEREELEGLLHSNIVEARREEIHQNALLAKADYKSGKLKSGSTVKGLSKLL